MAYIDTIMPRVPAKRGERIILKVSDRVMTCRKEYTPKELAEQFRQLKTLRAKVAEAELSQKLSKEANRSANAKQQRDPSAKQR